MSDQPGDATPSAAKNRFQRHRKKTLVFVVLLGVLVADVLAANVFRGVYGYAWALRNHPGTVEKIYRVRSDIYHHGLAENKSVVHARWGTLQYHVHTNSLGLKDRSVRRIPLSSDSRRIVFIGDSFTEGVGFAYEDTFVGLIDDALSSDGIEVLNAAAASYSPIVYWRKVLHLIEDKHLEFDELVVFLDMSDVVDEAFHYDLDDKNHVFCSDPLPGSDLHSVAVGGWQGLIRDNSIVTSTALNFFCDFVPDNNPRKPNDEGEVKKPYPIRIRCGSWTVNESDYEQFAKAGVVRMEHYMDRLWKLTNQHGIKLSVAVYPWPYHVLLGDANSRHVRIWRSWCDERGVQLINCFPGFQCWAGEVARKQAIEKYFISDDVHLSKAGHRRVAEIFLQSRSERIE